MIVKHNGIEYHISWQHTNNGNTRINGRRKGSYSQCVIAITKTEENITHTHHCGGMAVCHPEDQFSRKTGVKISFADALKNKNNFPDKAVRTVLWKAFLGLRGPKIYYHDGNPYRIIKELKAKFAGQWYDAVYYEALYSCSDGKFFVKTKEDFLANFSLYPSTSVPMIQLPPQPVKL